jgi:hypothetical protein
LNICLHLPPIKEKGWGGRKLEVREGKRKERRGCLGERREVEVVTIESNY